MFVTIICTALFFVLFYLLCFGQNSFSILMLLKTGVGVYILRGFTTKSPSLCAVITVSTLQTCGLILALTLSGVFLYFVIFNLSILTKVSYWCMYANCVWVCLCLYMANSKYKVGVKQWCWWHLLSTDKHTFNYLSKKPGVVQNIAFHITPTATY